MNTARRITLALWGVAVLAWVYFSIQWMLNKIMENVLFEMLAALAMSALCIIHNQLQ